MPRAPTREQALENAAFLRLLRRTGNVRQAARDLGAHRARFTKRRNAHPAFAAEWDAALAFAAARLNARDITPSTTDANAPRLIRKRAGYLQLRAPARRQLTTEHEQAFLAALSATANIRLAAKAAGFSHSAFYARRDASPAFAREMRMALKTARERIEMALIESFDPASARDDAWRRNDPPPIPSMTPEQAIMLLQLHDRSARHAAERPASRKLPAETREAWQARVAATRATQRVMQEEEENAIAIARLDAFARRTKHEPPAPNLPALDQVVLTPKPPRTRPRPKSAVVQTPQPTEQPIARPVEPLPDEADEIAIALQRLDAFILGLPKR
ncbi:hypothetical protein KCP91_05100 [Microvirga sp. SRT01]|uniref:Uncharacterized protein n=1 Tax=Sphingomonas longa TaxID=2778730 RepID=A0ABS2D497_9SPHN|nr:MULTISPECIES: hypothetical protein [Alphaproteobacteria]MBM6575740.1 hypothetical protein [Sphingomonas sp. BT552]MBR7708787.1 hypothetical protein [Microvirga sp. SRT01]